MSNQFGHPAASCSNGLVCISKSIGWGSKAQYNKLASGFTAAVRDPAVMGSCEKFTAAQCGKAYMPCGAAIGRTCWYTHHNKKSYEMCYLCEVCMGSFPAGYLLEKMSSTQGVFVSTGALKSICSQPLTLTYLSPPLIDRCCRRDLSRQPCQVPQWFLLCCKL